MSWRDEEALRERRRVDRHGACYGGLDDGRQFWLLALIGGASAIVCVVSSFLTGQYEVGAWLLGGLLLAALFAVWVSRTYRSKGRSDLRTPKEADAVEWEES